MRSGFRAMLACVLALGGVAKGEGTVTVDGVTITIPDGWKRADKDDNVVLTPRELPSGQTCTFSLLGGAPYKGPVKGQLETEWKGMEALGNMANDTGSNILGEGTATEVALRGGRIDNAGKQSVYVLLFIVKSNDRMEKMLLVSNSPEPFGKYGNEAAVMVSQGKYEVPKPPAPLKGIWLGLCKVKTSTDVECWNFMPDGVVYEGFPYGGLADVDLALQMQNRTLSIGKYQSDGDDVVVTIKRDKEPTRFTVSRGSWVAPVTRKFSDRRQMTKTSWTYFTDDVPTMLRMTKVDPCDGLKLSGKYKKEFSFEDKIPTIEFTADGGFTEDGVVRKIDPGTLDAKGTTVSSIAPEAGGSGRYAIAKNTLTLTYQDGTKVSLTFIATKDELEKKTPAEFYTQSVKLVLVP